jgi:hypothetical protein
MKIGLYIIAGWLTLAGLLVIMRVGGKPSKAPTGRVAAFCVVIDAAAVTVLILAAGKLP